MAPIHNPEQGIQEKPSPADPAATAIQTPAPALPSPNLSRATARPPQRTSRLEWALLGLLLLLSFFLASFAVTNNDFWMHLATGRLIAEGEYQFGVDPFSYASEGPWINQSWLFDWGLYAIYTLAGDTVLVVLKALLVVGMVLLLFQIRRPGETWILPIVMLTLAVLAMSFRLFLQPVLVSYLLFAVLVWLLFKEPAPAAETGGAPVPSKLSRRLWWIPALFLLWVNVDSWFIVGPIAVALVLLGSWVQRLLGGESLHAPKQLAAVLGVGLLACLVNPHHVQAFQLPFELAYPLVTVADTLHIPLPDVLVVAGRTMQQVQQFAPQSTQIFSTFSSEFLQLGQRSFVIAPWAYFVLLALTAGSFVLCTPAVPNAASMSWSRLFPWAFFTLLTIVQARIVPFMAILSAPIAVLNVQDYLGRRREAAAPGRTPPRWLGLARFGLCAGLAALLFLAWPGWLLSRVGDPHSRHRVAWRVQPDEGLKQTALALRELHHGGKLQNGFNYHPDIVAYSAWYAPGLRWFHDYRFALFPTTAARYGKLQQELIKEAASALNRQLERVPFELWLKATHEHDINYLVLPVTPGSASELLLVRRWLNDQDWPMLYENGQIVVFGWDGDGKWTFAGLKKDFQAAAFGNVPKEERAPAVGTDPPLKPYGFWREYAFGLPKEPLPRKEAALYQRHFDISRGRWIQPYALLWGPMSFNVPAASAAVVPGTVYLQNLAFLYERVTPSLMERPPRGRDLGDPALPLLAVRRAREGLAASPNDLRSYLALFSALNLLISQENHWAGVQIEPIVAWSPGQTGVPGQLRTTLRHIELLTALNSAVVLDPTNPKLHEALADMYLRMFYLDAAQEHLSQALKHIEHLRPPNEARKEEHKYFEEMRKSMRLNLERLEAEIKTRRENFDLHAGRLDIVNRLRVAILQRYEVPDPKTGKRNADPRMGLAKHALKMLQEEPVEQLKKVPFVVHTQMGLMLMLGQSRQVREVLPGLLESVKEPPKDILDFAEYLQVRQSLLTISLWAAASVGDYKGMDDALTQLEGSMPAALEEQAKRIRAGLVYQLTADPLISRAGWLYSLGLQQSWILVSQRLGELRVLRGLMALEQGDTAAAQQHFQRALEPRIFFPDRPIAERYLELLKAQ